MMAYRLSRRRHFRGVGVGKRCEEGSLGNVRGGRWGREDQRTVGVDRFDYHFSAFFFPYLLRMIRLECRQTRYMVFGQYNINANQLNALGVLGVMGVMGFLGVRGN